MAKIFIDGEVGTTGLQIRGRLEKRSDITLISIPHEHRKDNAARRDAYAAADVAILCLPDDAAIEAAALAADLPVRLIDASTAHRVHPDWVFGLPELNAYQPHKIAKAKRVSNPGCWSTCAISLLAPLVTAGVMHADMGISIHGVSGYSGGGKAMIEAFDAGSIDTHFIYGLDQKHKHIPEIMAYTGLKRQPIFVPSVGRFEQGMIVQIALHLPSATVEDALRAHYIGAHFVKVVSPQEQMPRLSPTRLNGTNMLELCVHSTQDGASCLLTACLDNLGKGASGAAVQNLDIMLGKA